MGDSPTEEEKEQIFDKYYQKQFEDVLKLPEFRKNVMDRNKIKTEVHNFLFNETKTNLGKSTKKKNAGDIRKYGIVKHGFDWYKDKIIKAVSKMEGKRPRWNKDDKQWVKDNISKVPAKAMLKKFAERTSSSVYKMRWRAKTGQY